MGKINIKTKLLLLALLLCLPRLVLANAIIVSTVKTPDPYNGNQSWFKFYEYPGTTVTDSILLRNLGNNTETVKLYAADATSNQAGSFSPKMENDQQKGLGNWTRLSANEVTLAPDETREVSFQIKIPQEIAPGQYFGSIIVEQINNECAVSQAVSNSCEGNIQIKTRTGNRIYLTIPGETKHDIKLQNLRWKKTDSNSVHFTFNFVNNGNIAFEPRAVIQLYDNWGNKISTLESKLGKSLPMTSISPSMEWKYGQNFGDFTAKVEIYYLEQDQGRFDNLRGTVLNEKDEVKIFIFPWLLFVWGISLTVLLSSVYFARKFLIRRQLRHCFDYTVEKDQNLIDLAERFQVKWKTIARINKLKAPYVLHENQLLKIPQPPTQSK
jgi:hypothetical protein